MTPIRLRLALELAAWRRQGRQAVLWWRDDDAQDATPALARLVDLADRRRTPLTLAVIPHGVTEALAAAVAQRPHVRIAQHGVDHQNRNSGPAAGEFPPSWTSWEIAARLRVGWSRIEALPGVRRIYVPPWNHVHPELFAALADCGYEGWSAWGTSGAAPERIDAHLDLMRWRGGARFRGRGRFESALLRALRERRRAERWDAPIGLLTHHLDHDAAAWAYLERFLGWSHSEPVFIWRGLAELMAEARLKTPQADDGRRRPDPRAEGAASKPEAWRAWPQVGWDAA